MSLSRMRLLTAAPRSRAAVGLILALVSNVGVGFVIVTALSAIITSTDGGRIFRNVYVDGLSNAHFLNTPFLPSHI